MILTLAITLIFSAIMSLLSLRKKKERLSIFNKITQQKVSLLSLVEAQINDNKESFIKNVNQAIANKIKTNYYLLLGESQDKLKLIGMIMLGIIACFVANFMFLNLNGYLVFFGGLFITINVLIFVKKFILAKRFYDNFPEALNTITGIVSAGSSVSVGFKECANKMDGPVAQVMRDICGRWDIGENPQTVLLNSYRRLPFPEYYFFVLTIIVNLDGGGELKDVLSRLSKMLTNNRILVKTRDSKTAELRMTVWVLAAIPIGFIFILKGIVPENYHYLVDTDGGHKILYYVVGSVVFGVLLIKKMISKIV